MEGFTNAFRFTIAENGGYDSAQLVSERVMHATGNTTAGLNIYEGTTGDMVELGVTESFSVKQQVLLSVAEAAAMILRVDGCQGVFLEDLREGPQNVDNLVNNCIYSTKFTNLFGTKDQHSFRATYYQGLFLIS